MQKIGFPHAAQSAGKAEAHLEMRPFASGPKNAKLNVVEHVSHLVLFGSGRRVIRLARIPGSKISFSKAMRA